jgi:hypothetical protein
MTHEPLAVAILCIGVVWFAIKVAVLWRGKRDDEDDDT